MAVGPLKNKKTRHQTVQQWDIETWTRTRPGVPSGTVADIYIYIYQLTPDEPHIGVVMLYIVDRFGTSIESISVATGIVYK